MVYSMVLKIFFWLNGRGHSDICLFIYFFEQMVSIPFLIVITLCLSNSNIFISWTL